MFLTVELPGVVVHSVYKPPAEHSASTDCNILFVISSNPFKYVDRNT